MTAQEVFNTVWERMTAQGMPALEGDTCFMRTPSAGLKCAFGCLLTDDEAREVPNMRIGTFPDEQIPEHLREHKFLLAELQRAHDDEALAYDKPLSTWLERFQLRAGQVAEDFGLVVPEVG